MIKIKSNKKIKMDEETFNKAQNLIIKISEKEEMLNKTNTQQAEWITFSFGNGSSQSIVCNDLSVIEEVRTLLVASHETRLQFLKDEFAKL